MRILLIDDNPDDRALISRELGKEFSGLRVDQLGDAQSFERALEGDSYDLVVTDYQLRWSDGLAVLRAVQARHPGVPVIMFTATGSEEIAVEAMKAGLEDYVLKSPRHFSRLRAAVRLALDRSRDRRALAAAESRHRRLFEAVPIGLFHSSPDGRILDANPALVRLLGYPDRQTLAAASATQAWMDPGERARWREEIEREVAARGFEIPLRRADGSMVWTRTFAQAVRAGDGRALHYEGSVEDITERKRAEQALEKLAALPRSNPNPLMEFSADGAMIFFNEAAKSMAAAAGRDHPTAILPANVAAIVRDCLAAGKERLGLETTVGDRTLAWSFIPLASSGTVFGYAFDITDRLNLEEQLRQSHKLEAVGRLAGGVAHDFTNLLTAITGHVEMLMNRLDAQDPLRHDAEEIRRAAERATSLTRQLLAFGRRQALQPRVIDLGSLVAGLDGPLRRVLGEGIELVRVQGKDRGGVQADPAQLEQVLLNLAANAREAMPQGGRLTIETRNVDLDEAYAGRHAGVRPGPYVMLAVTDTGSGLDEETQAHIFEPFFTTREMGKGAGLGMATVYGVVRQSGGNILVRNEVRIGTTFRIYLPRVDQPAEMPASITMESRPPVGLETILIAEDEEVVGDLVREILESQGYKVLGAAGGEEALRVCAGHGGPIHLLVTDVMLPGMRGRELGARAAEQRPEMRVLYLSDFTDEAMVQHGVLDPGAALLQKPFTPAALAFKVRQVLDSPREPAVRRKRRKRPDTPPLSLVP